MKNMTLLVAHGSSDLEWANTFVELTKPARQNHENTRLAFMELSSPSIEEVVTEAAKDGVEHINVLPLFLAKGKHLKKDIPNKLSALEQQYGLTTTLLPAIGLHPVLATAISSIIDEVNS